MKATIQHRRMVARPMLYWAVAALGLLGLMSLVNQRGAAAATEASPYVTAYAIPTAAGEPTNIIALGPGQVWYTLQDASAIGKLVVAGNGQATFNQYPTPTANSAPYDLAYDGQYIWFTELQGNRIGRLTPSNGAIVEYPIPTANSQPMGIAVAPDGTVWFVERAGNKIARFKPATSTFDEFAYPVAGALPEDVGLSQNDSIWFTAPGLNLVVNFFPNEATPDRQFEPVPVLDFGVPPWAPGNIAVLDDNPWITAPTKDLVGRYAPGTLNYWRWYQLFNEGTGARGIFLQRTGDLYRTWFTEPDGNRAGLLFTSRLSANEAAFYEQPLPGNDPRPMGITVDADGTAWITAPGTNSILAWRQPYFYQAYLPSTIAH